jgi:pimeloyl-ACP methyl ester carboxylesterase
LKQAEGYAIVSDGVRIAWRDEGPADAPAILFCTMGTAAMSVWDAIALPLAADWRVIRHDRRGDGDSDAGAEACHTFPRYAQDALAVLDHLGVGAAVVCGMAFGARVALRLALDAPQRVLGLALFDATGGPPAPEAERNAGRDEAARLREAAGLPQIAVDRRWFARRDLSGAGRSRNAFKDQPAWLAGLPTIAVPTLVACGEQDPNFAGAQRLAGEIAGASFTAMPMCGHASILERPDLVLELLRGFLRVFSTSLSKD